MGGRTTILGHVSGFALGGLALAAQIAEVVFPARSSAVSELAEDTSSAAPMLFSLRAEVADFHGHVC
jgi:hypothetical protein